MYVYVCLHVRMHMYIACKYVQDVHIMQDVHITEMNLV